MQGSARYSCDSITTSHRIELLNDFDPQFERMGRPTAGEDDGVTPMACTAGQTYVIWSRWEGQWRKRAVDNKVWRGWCESSPTLPYQRRVGTAGVRPHTADTMRSKIPVSGSHSLRVWAANNTSGTYQCARRAVHVCAAHCGYVASAFDQRRKAGIQRYFPR